MIGVGTDQEADMGEQRDKHTAEPEDLDVEEREAEDVKGGQEIISPRDAASGLPTGKRQHKPLGYIGETEKNLG
jgi:hypothetical protein